MRLAFFIVLTNDPLIEFFHILHTTLGSLNFKFLEGLLLSEDSHSFDKFDAAWPFGVLNSSQTIHTSLDFWLGSGKEEP